MPRTAKVFMTNRSQAVRLQLLRSPGLGARA